jgi:hypothetical protein
MYANDTSTYPTHFLAAVPLRVLIMRNPLGNQEC